MNPNVAKIGRQLQEIWKQLGTNQRVSVVLATAATFLGILAVAWWSGRAEYSLLYGKLSDGEASRVIAALDDAKVAYKVGAGGGSILVPSEKVHLVRMQLAGKGIPRSDGVGFEIFDKPNFGISDFVQRANYVRALQGELARTIAQIDEVESARVMVVLPENRLLLDKDKHATASVFIRLRGNTQLQPQAVSSIRFLVANSVEGLKPNFVSIVDNQGNVLSENVENDSLVGLTATQLDARRNLEQYLARKAEGMLEKVLGPGQAIVRVAAELNFDSTQRTEEKFDPDGQVARLTTKETSTDDSTTANGGEVAGVSANTPGSSAGTNAAGPLTNSKNKKITDTTQYRSQQDDQHRHAGRRRHQAPLGCRHRGRQGGRHRVRAQDRQTPGPGNQPTEQHRQQRPGHRLDAGRPDPTRGIAFQRPVRHGSGASPGNPGPA